MSDISENADNAGHLVEESDDAEWDKSDQDDSPQKAHLLDLEAVESSSSDSSEGDFSIDESDQDSQEPFFFPQFKRLPFELRERIWQFFCPDLTAKARAFHFHCVPPSAHELAHGYRPPKDAPMVPIWNHAFLEQQTRPARTMLALHRETRELALRSFPDALSFRRNSILRFNAKTDVIFLDSIGSGSIRVRSRLYPEDGLFDLGFTRPIQHLAVDPYIFPSVQFYKLQAMFRAFRNVKNVYYVLNASDHRPEKLAWCASDMVSHYNLVTFEEEPGLGENSSCFYCWPDVERNRTFAEQEIPVAYLLSRANVSFFDDGDVVELLPDGVPAWPLIQFHFDPEKDPVEQLSEAIASNPDWHSPAGEDWQEEDEISDSELDEYESEGIDDSEISEDGSTNSSELDVLDEGDNPHHAHFSSPEQSSSTVEESDGSESDGSDSDRSASDQPAPRSTWKRSRGRVIESESESEDDSEESPPRKRVRIDNRRSRALPEDDDEERETPSGDDGHEEQGEKDTDPQVQDSEGEWSGIASSDDDENPAGGASLSRPMTLAEKLQQHRDKVRIPDSGDDDPSDVEEMGNDDYDARNYADFQDDEEGVDISGEDDDGEQDEEFQGPEQDGEQDYEDEYY
ncbi:hypothetical protein N656DRAFT_785549 [Canariomyces notabilis]|uniref:2EXR domain-containing protein n=1 Tax=Canariomyces notabilis TaxID=2074819 RepID=A0AAN6QE93_9PEZI|nr:hypothetical protein N656DRAFT_785549 [Canariomyces arenarius]